MVRLDQLDKKILFELDLNSRQSYKQLAKKVRSSKEVVAYRIKRLEKNKVIFCYLSVFDPAKLGFFLHKVMFKLENIDAVEKEKVIQYLKNHPYSLWTVECDGPFDIGFMAFARNLSELDKVLTEVSSKLSKYIHKRVVSTNIFGGYLSRRYLVNNKQTRQKPEYGGLIQNKKLDEIDWEILFALSKDAKIPITEIAKSVPIKIDAVRDRIKRMEQKGVISGYSILINNEMINQLHYKILIYLKDFSEQKFKALREFCLQYNNFIYIIKSLGVWDIELDMEVESAEKYRKIMLDLLKQFPNMIRKYDVLQIYKLHHYSYLPNRNVIK